MRNKQGITNRPSLRRGLGRSADKTVDTLLGEALKQIHDRRYYNKYTGKVLLLGIAFSGKQPGCRMEALNNQK
jgi:hypothetical protein